VNTHGHARRLIGTLAWRQRYARTARPQHDGRHGHVQPVEALSCDETRNCVSPPFDQDPAHPLARQRTNDSRWLDITLMRRQGDGLNASRWIATCPFSRDQQATNAVVCKQSGTSIETSSRINNGADRLRPRDLPDCQLGIVSHRRADTDNNDVYQCAQPVKMLNAGWAIDILRMAGSRRNSAIQRLAELTDDHKIIDGTIAKGTEHI